MRLSLALSMEKPRPLRSGTLLPRSSSSRTPQKLRACLQPQQSPQHADARGPLSAASCAAWDHTLMHGLLWSHGAHIADRRPCMTVSLKLCHMPQVCSSARLAHRQLPPEAMLGLPQGAQQCSLGTRNCTVVCRLGKSAKCRNGSRGAHQAVVQSLKRPARVGALPHPRIDAVQVARVPVTTHKHIDQLLAISAMLGRYTTLSLLRQALHTQSEAPSGQGELLKPARTVENTCQQAAAGIAHWSSWHSRPGRS